MSHNTLAAGVEIEEIGEENGRQMLNEQAMDKLGISGAEFLVRLDRGEYQDTGDENVVRLAMLAPFGR